MCFSATASLTSGVALVGTGVVTMKKAKDTNFKPLSIVPLLFGVQQITEGFVWLGLKNEAFAPAVNVFAYAFLMFAWFVWPLLIPYSMIHIEPKGIRRNMLIMTEIIGLIVAVALGYVLFFKGIDPEIRGNSIFYHVHIHTTLGGIMGILYLFCTVLPPLLSGVKKVWILGVVTGILYVVAKLFYEEDLLSVWCFFAAIGSIIVLWIIHINTRTSRDSSEAA